MLYFLQGWRVHILIRFTVRSFSDVDWKDWVYIVLMNSAGVSFFFIFEHANDMVKYNYLYASTISVKMSRNIVVEELYLGVE